MKLMRIQFEGNKAVQINIFQSEHPAFWSTWIYLSGYHHFLYFSWKPMFLSGLQIGYNICSAQQIKKKVLDFT